MVNLGCRRPLNNRPLTEDFVQHVLKIVKDYDAPAMAILNAELNLKPLESHPTATHEDHRDPKYRTPEQRSSLHEQILRELITEERLEDDNDIVLEKGGARPEVTQSNAQAYIVSGAPASGKSGIAVRLAHENGAYILDSDYAKRKFPEYFSYSAGASLVHQESDGIIFGPENSLFEYCVYSRHNVVIPLVGKTYESVETICKRLALIGYQIHIINVSLDRYQCVLRAYKRFCSTNRYVPLSYIFDEVGNEPERVYFLIKRAYSNNSSFKSFSQLSTAVEQGNPPRILEATPNSPVCSWEK